MVIFARAFRAFDQHFPAKTEIKGKGKPVPVQAYYRLRGFQKVEAPTLQDSQHMKMVRL
jgi:hypothetical protein